MCVGVQTFVLFYFISLLVSWSPPSGRRDRRQPRGGPPLRAPRGITWALAISPSFLGRPIDLSAAALFQGPYVTAFICIPFLIGPFIQSFMDIFEARRNHGDRYQNKRELIGWNTAMIFYFKKSRYFPKGVTWEREYLQINTTGMTFTLIY